MKRSALALTLAAALTAPAAAQAADPFTVGEGDFPHVAVDPLSGTGHVVWVNGPAKTIGYCRVPRGATACVSTTTLDASDGGYGPGIAFVLLDGSTLRIVDHLYATDKTVQYVSTDGGASWSAPQVVYDFGNVTNPSEPVLGPQPGSFTIAGFNPTSSVWAPATDGSEAAKTDRAELTGGAGANDLQIAPTGDGGLVAVGYGDGAVRSWRMAPGADPSATAAWTGPTTIGPGGESRVAGGAGGAYVLSSTTVPGRVEIRKWTGAGFGAPTTLAEEVGYINDVFVAPAGSVAAIFRANDDPNRLMYSLSTDAGASYTTGVLAREDAIMRSMDVAIGDDERGFAVYEGTGGGATAQIRAVPIDGPPTATGGTGTGTGTGTEVPPTKTTKAAVPGGQLSFAVTKACVPANGRVYGKLSFKRFRRNASGRLVVLKIRSADFFVGLKKAKTDRTAPFVQWLTIANATPGRSYTLKVKVKLATRSRLRSPTKTVSSKVTICPS